MKLLGKNKATPKTPHTSQFIRQTPPFVLLSPFFGRVSFVCSKSVVLSPQCSAAQVCDEEKERKKIKDTEKNRKI
jgi:hypothetical protein